MHQAIGWLLLHRVYPYYLGCAVLVQSRRCNNANGVTINCQDDTVDVVDAAGANGACMSALTCQRNYVIIPGALSPRTCAATLNCYLPKDGSERYCGTILTPEGNVALAPSATRLSPVTSCQRPFRMYSATGDCGTNANNGVAAPVGVSSTANANGDEGATGWAFTYRQLPGNC